MTSRSLQARIEELEEELEAERQARAKVSHRFIFIFMYALFNIHLHGNFPDLRSFTTLDCSQSTR